MSSDETPRERLVALLKTPYDSEGEVWQALLSAFANEYEEFEQTLTEVQKQKFVETATGEPLNKIADLFGLNRRQDETVDAFRVRVKAALRSQITTATVEEVRDIVALLLATDVENVNVEEPFDRAQAQILLDVRNELSTVDITSSQFIDVVDAAVAAGVGVGILLTEELEDTLTLDDVAAVQTDVVGSEVPILDDTTHTRIEESTQSFWNEGRWNLDHYDTLKAVLEDEVHPVTIVLNDATAVDDMLLVASESPVISDGATVQIDVIAIEEIAVSDTVHERIEPVETAYWNEGRWNIDAYAEL